jgi:hypothetical protein
MLDRSEFGRVLRSGLESSHAHADRPVLRRAAFAQSIVRAYLGLSESPQVASGSS